MSQTDSQFVPPPGSEVVNPLARTRRSIRKLASYAAYSGIVPPPAVFRPSGISAIVIAKNEEEWAEASMLSVVDCVDEVVAADHGSEDGTGEILAGIADDYPERVRLLKFTEEPFPVALNAMLVESRFRWILRFNADFVARTSGPHSVPQLVAELRAMDPLRYYCISLSGIALDGDLHHQFPNRRDPFEPLAFTYSPRLRYGVKERWETLNVPWFYEKLELPDAYYFHMRSVKSLRRMMQKLYWSHWFDARNRGSQISLRDFVAQNAMRDWGGSTVEEAAKSYIIEEFGGCVPYSKEACGEYPDILIPALANPPFQLIWDRGKLVDRIERHRYRPKEWKARI